uniref:glucoside xylosyltransferase 1-like n=1 Tax=Myxine glutinosa TaxID=7769 RepID=UPI00358E2E26
MAPGSLPLMVALWPLLGRVSSGNRLREPSPQCQASFAWGAPRAHGRGGCSYWGTELSVCPSHQLLPMTSLGTNPTAGTPCIQLSVVACGPRLQETLVMLKSSVLTMRSCVHAHIFAEDELHGAFRAELAAWPAAFKKSFSFTMYAISFPQSHTANWKQLFKPCASQRLFLPLILQSLDAVLYVDTDILFLSPVEDLWSYFYRFNSSQLAGMAPEHEATQIGWYNRFARHPYFGKTGINSGVMLFNLTRVRQTFFKNDLSPSPLPWDDLLLPLYHKYRLNLTWGDQDLLNIIFHHNSEKLYVLPCQWNFRPDHCMYGLNCATALPLGAHVLHGNRGVYHNDKQPAFSAVYEAIRHFPFGGDVERHLLAPLRAALQGTEHTYCGRMPAVFTASLQCSTLTSS